jgi:DNA-binding IclR family transcriptional regulator
LSGVPRVAATPHSITDSVVLRRLARARKDGFAEIRDGNIEGASGVSAPVFREGVAKAALDLVRRVRALTGLAPRRAAR